MKSRKEKAKALSVFDFSLFTLSFTLSLDGAVAGGGGIEGESIMSKVESQRLEEIAEINPSLSLENIQESGQIVSFVSMASISDVTYSITNSDERSIEECWKGYTPFQKNDILIAKITPCFENGKVAIADISHEVGFGSTEFHVIRANKHIADTRYLYHIFRTENFRQQGQMRMTGSAGQKRVPSNYLSTFDIPLPPLAEQKRIAAILDKADELRTKRRAAIAKLDTLTQAIFIDMFGDPATNPKGWPCASLGALVLDVTNGMTRRRASTDQGQSIVLRLRDIREGWIDFSDVNRISLTSDESRKYQVAQNDLLFIRVNGNPEYVGRCALFAGYLEPVYFNDHIMRVRVENSMIDSHYLAFLLNSPYGKSEIAKQRKTSAGQHTINQVGLRAIKLILPPIHLQMHFASKSSAILKTKGSHAACLTVLNSLFSSLQQRAFRGEL